MRFHKIDQSKPCHMATSYQKQTEHQVSFNLKTLFTLFNAYGNKSIYIQMHSAQNQMTSAVWLIEWPGT